MTTAEKTQIKVFAPDGGLMGIATANDDQVEGIIEGMAEAGLTTEIIEEEENA